MKIQFELQHRSKANREKTKLENGLAPISCHFWQKLELLIFTPSFATSLTANEQRLYRNKLTAELMSSEYVPTMKEIVARSRMGMSLQLIESRQRVTSVVT